MPILTVVGGPNGAGKSTIVRHSNFEGLHNLLDTDAIAKELNPTDPLQAAVTAGREVIRRTRSYIEARESFVLETTLSGNLTLKVMEAAIKEGFTVNLSYMYLADPDKAMERVRERAAQGAEKLAPALEQVLAELISGKHA